MKIKAERARLKRIDHLRRNGLVIAGAFLVSALFGYAAFGAAGDRGQVEAADAVATVGPTPKPVWPPYPPGEGPGRGPALVEPPGPDVTPIPGATPDTTQPWWYVPYLNAERGKPPFEGLVNGIRIQSAPLDVGAGWACRDYKVAPLSEASGTALAIEPPYLPMGARPTHESSVLSPSSVAVFCDGQIVSAEGSFEILVPDDAPFGVRGGSLSVFRYKGLPAASVSIPEGRWRQGEVLGHPAALAEPIVKEGFGQSAVVVWHDAFVTKIVGQGLPLNELTQIAEGLFR